MPLNHADFDYVRSLVRQRSAIVLEDDKSYLVESRLLALARRVCIPSAEDLVQQLRASADARLRDQVVEAMTTNETLFFRDIKPFEALAQVVLPDLMKRRAQERQLQIWCAACSSGQEPYSIAMTLRERFLGSEGWRFSILATDLSREMVERAQQARYNQAEVNRGLPARHLVKYFQREGLEWQLKNELRQMVQFRVMNLTDAWPFLPRADVVFLRNVLIYFDVPTKKQILGKVRKILQPDGYLFLGGAETTLNIDDTFERIELDRAGCYRLRHR